ncbi:iron-containing alcohol dehydrogenase [Virgibacillus sediminis]|uniref:Iron-containing alcohol dehydrogenase n=1 Tax=Virgibacillus sediminis TaxID=202260 RepID=A0ABV7A4Q2_9BACI
MIYQFLPVESVHYGADIVNDQLITEIRKLNGKRALIVTTNSLLKVDEYQKMIQSLHAEGITTYEMSVKQHVPGKQLMGDIQKIRAFGPDVIISCGGGSPIDAGKILSLALAEGIDSEQELYPFSEMLRTERPKMGRYVPNFAIPTTLSAAEFTSIAGATNSKDQIKYKFSHPHMTPQQVFLDPVFTKQTPDWLWLSTGIRAVDHAVETLYSPTPNPVNSGLALQALKKLYHYLPLSHDHPENMEYRLECQLGAWLSLFSVVNIKLGLSHSIGHQLGALYNIPHGMTSAIMLPKVMKFLLPRTIEQQAAISEVLGFSEPGKDMREIAEQAPEIISGLIKRLEIPHRLRDFNIDAETLPQLVANVLTDIRGEENEFVMETQELEKEINNLIKSVW